MTDKLALLDLVKAGGYDASLITTYSVSFEVYEHLVLRKLVGAGCRYNVVLADQQQLAAAWSAPELRPQLAGSAYTLAPIRMAGAFHPKIWLLAGRKKALLVVGSHNLTLAGLGYNKELTTIIELGAKPDEMLDGLVSEAWRAVRSWVAHSEDSLPGAVVDAVHRVQTFIDPYLRPASLRSPVSFHVQEPEGRTLFEAIESLSGASISRVAVLGPFLDLKMELLRTLHERWPSAFMAIGITPESLVTRDVFDLPHVRCVDADMLGKGTSNRYVHAKALYLEATDGQHLLAVGSANPSAPAWLDAAGGRNAEAMIVVRGELAARITEQIGLLRLFDAPPMSQDDARLDRAVSVELESTSEAGSNFLGVASLDPARGVLDVFVGRHLVERYSLRGIDDAAILDGSVTGSGKLSLQLPADRTLSSVRLVHLYTAVGGVLTAIVHNVAIIEPLAQGTGHEQVRKALTSLTDDDSNLSEVIDAVHKVIFDREPLVVARQSAGTGGRQAPGDAASQQRPDTLAISEDQMAQRGPAKHKALKSGDLAYLIDVLIRRLAVEPSTSPDVTDRHGRNEEEQSGQDDDQPPPQPAGPRTDILDDPAIAAAVGLKIKKMVSRMLDYLDRAVDDVTVPAAIARLIAVLALLREVRRIESLPRWREKHLSLVPEDAREILFDRATKALFGQRQGLMRRFEALIGDNTEEAGRMRALLAWLAWDLGAQYTERFPLSMELEEVERRVRSNAILFELMSSIATDEDQLATLRESIALTAAKSLKSAQARQIWVARHIQLGTRWSQLRSVPIGDLTWEANVQCGDIAASVRASAPELHVVAEVTDSYVGLSVIDRVVKYTPDSVVRIHRH